MHPFWLENKIQNSDFNGIAYATNITMLLQCVSAYLIVHYGGFLSDYNLYLEKKEKERKRRARSLDDQEID